MAAIRRPFLAQVAGGEAQEVVQRERSYDTQAGIIRWDSTQARGQSEPAAEQTLSTLDRDVVIPDQIASLIRDFWRSSGVNIHTKLSNINCLKTR